MTIPPADTAIESSKPKTQTLSILPAPLDGFAWEEFQGRRERLRTACPDGLIVVRGATEDEIPHGSASVYRQNSMFFYLTGVDTPGAFLVLLPESLPASVAMRDASPNIREILFLPARNPAMETWTGAKWGPGNDIEIATGIQKSADAIGLLPALTAWIMRNPTVYTVVPYGESAVGTREFAFMESVRRVAPVVQFQDIRYPAGQMRVRKSPAELARIGEAIAITAEGHRAARTLIANGTGRWEYEIEAQVFAAFRSRNAILGFATIAGTGINGTTLHYEDNQAQMQDGDLVVVDIGARFGHYTGDLTRTYPVGGKFSPRQREIYELVLAAHDNALATFQCGIDTLKTINDRCKEFLKASPLRAKDGTGEEKTMDVFMPHSLGHHLGLDVHDVGDRDLPLLPDAVITIEPGIYIPSEAIGVRLENDYRVTPDGLERLGPDLEIEPDAVEAAMRPAS